MSSSPDHSVLESLRALVVDDHEINRAFLLHGLAGRVAGVDATASGPDAVECCNRTEYDLILMDLHMPGQSGLEAARAIRKLDASSSLTPILFLTADIDHDAQQALTEAGFEHCLRKPIGIDALLAAMVGLLQEGKLPPRAGEAPLTRPALLTEPEGSSRHPAQQARIQRLRRRFGQELERGLIGLERGLARQQLDRSRARLHQWSGAAGFVGAPALGQACRELERVLASGRRQRFGPAWMRFARTARATSRLLSGSVD